MEDQGFACECGNREFWCFIKRMDIDIKGDIQIRCIKCFTDYIFKPDMKRKYNRKEHKYKEWK